ncbi:hypothetical protein NQ315_000477 [Exocentrus adspersus]|uniref:Chitin-binding type-4 domain-containing protein n=1 Tax=Exocentrus adspersus TaxID=1586481 RepID=A0AAV8VEP5_9CUCU|nr:hypothetical protein NQ315_000477 [Exocentrus adspersus]
MTSNQSKEIDNIEMKSCLLLFVAAVIAREVVGHGMMLEPPNRSSMWRFEEFSGILPHYYDDGGNCGGLTVYKSLGMKCGLCGDAWSDPRPRDNENTGKYGSGLVVRTYQAGSVIETQINITVNHKGTFTYSLCVLPNPNAPEPGEECFQTLTFEDGSSIYNIQDQTEGTRFHVNNRVKLPPGLTCDRCVLRWHYRVANNWGQCDDGTSALGCGDQEIFRSCADIAIV